MTENKINETVKHTEATELKAEDLKQLLAELILQQMVTLLADDPIFPSDIAPF